MFNDVFQPRVNVSTLIQRGLRRLYDYLISFMLSACLAEALNALKFGTTV
jgi:hypothetical protein